MSVQPVFPARTVEREASPTAARHALHTELMELNRRRLCPATPTADWREDLHERLQLELREGAFLEAERAAVRTRAAEAPSDPRAFAAWFDALRERGPGQYDPLFDYLANDASRDEVRWFVQQEVAGEAGFDDLVALTQLRMPDSAKLELARNYWDEMGRGKAAGMHGPMLGRLADELDVAHSDPSEIVWEALAVGNVLAGLACNRRYGWHSLGALGAVELTAPTRAVRVVEALERVGLEGDAVYYFKLHSTIDVVHWRGWRDHALIPVVQECPELVPHIAEGALMRLQAGARTFERYRRELGLRPSSLHRS